MSACPPASWHLELTFCLKLDFAALPSGCAFPVALTTFKQLWCDDFSHYKIPKSNRFSKCDICSRAKQHKTERTLIEHDKNLSAEQREQARRELQERIVNSKLLYMEHKEDFTRERVYLYDVIRRVGEQRGRPDADFFFMIDSMDSAKTEMPHFIRLPKDIKGDLRFKYHVTSVCYDDRNTRPDDVYLYPDIMPHDASTTCTIIWKVLMKVRGSLWAHDLVPSIFGWSQFTKLVFCAKLSRRWCAEVASFSTFTFNLTTQLGRTKTNT